MKYFLSSQIFPHQRPIDAHDACRSVLLPEVDGAQDERDDHGLGDPHLHDQRVLDHRQETSPQQGLELFPPGGFVWRLPGVASPACLLGPELSTPAPRFR